MVAVRGFLSFSLVFALLPITPAALAQQVGECAWCTKIEEQISSMQQQISALLAYYTSKSGTSQFSATVSRTSTTTRFTPETFGSAPTTSLPRISSIFSSIPTKSSSRFITASGSTVTRSSSRPVPTSSSVPTIPPEPPLVNSNGYRNIAYFVNWGIYGRKYFPQDIPAEKLTHVLYSFGDNREDGEVVLTDPWSDVQIHYEGDSWNDQGNNLYGNLKQLNLLKKRNRNLKILLSIGGWTYTNVKKHMDTPAATEQGRKSFANSCVKMIQDVGFDGIDIDWEYPQNSTQGQQFQLLLKEIRTAMEAYADKLAAGSNERPHFELSISAPTGADNYNNIPLGSMAQELDFINLMSYDYTGSWSRSAGHQANLNASVSCPTCTPFNTRKIVKDYLFQGVPSNKLVIGMPLYGRSFTNTSGIGQPYKGVGRGSWENGIWDFKALPRPGAQDFYDDEAGAAYSYDNITRTLITYDTLPMVLKKVEYIKANRLGGAMWWELTGDRQDQGSLVVNVANALGGPHGAGLEHKSNWLKYPDSQYDNLRNGFPTE